MVIEVKFIELYRDGGTELYKDINGKEYYADFRLGHKETRGQIYDKYPGDEGARKLDVELKRVSDFPAPTPLTNKLSSLESIYKRECEKQRSMEGKPYDDLTTDEQEAYKKQSWKVNTLDGFRRNISRELDAFTALCEAQHL